MAPAVQVLVGALGGLLGLAWRTCAEHSPPLLLLRERSVANDSQEVAEPRVEAARETHMAAAAAAGPVAAAHPLLTLLLVLVIGSASVAAALGLQRVLRRLVHRDRLGSYRYFRVNQDDDGELAEVNGEYQMGLDDSSEDELGPARLPVNTPEAAEVRRSCGRSPPPEAKSLLIESSDEELIQ
ncbi:uncharacterized protein LOC119092972 [Pollicipes pollicipes]|uniref:uncharacterized protein LOC119092963 n=1 Tax=Pollicipes pollicipes TaxID=41117 RepID=UPI00188551E0|nr:uncharacterized protein LOC119092963 [Pollicipes pollicipes]XP_037071761.1 uncharacterized protein LOC119092972 [Pollicipes pollicipes]